MISANAPRETSEHELREELEQLVKVYRHLHDEHRRSGASSRARRRLEHRLAGVAERFERRLRAAVPDEHDRAQWREHLYHGAASPAEIEGVAPLVFRGRSEAGSELLIRRLPSGDLEVTIDGTPVERLYGADELLSPAPHLTFGVGGQLYRETFRVPAGALSDLEQTLATGKPVPGLQALSREGLISHDLELTPRGRRALAHRPQESGAFEEAESPIEIVARGRVGHRSRQRLQNALSRIAAGSPRPVLFVRGTLIQEENPSLARPAVAEATLHLGGRVARARARAGELTEAIDLLVEQLHRAVRELRRREEAERRESGVPEPGRWRHGDLPSHPRRLRARRRR
jgi:ribosome-associated translation inhibitor RaiA